MKNINKKYIIDYFLNSSFQGSLTPLKYKSVKFNGLQKHEKSV